MKQIKGMLRDTWWMWLLFFVLITVCCIYVSWMMSVMYPVMIIICLYFAFMRYDETGHEKKKK